MDHMCGAAAVANTKKTSTDTRRNKEAQIRDCIEGKEEEELKDTHTHTHTHTHTLSHTHTLAHTHRKSSVWRE